MQNLNLGVYTKFSIDLVDADVRAGLTKLGFQTTSVSPVPNSPDQFKIYPNPCSDIAFIDLTDRKRSGQAQFVIRQ